MYGSHGQLCECVYVCCLCVYVRKKDREPKKDTERSGMLILRNFRTTSTDKVDYMTNIPRRSKVLFNHTWVG